MKKIINSMASEKSSQNSLFW